MPPACAMAMAMRASVTVSMAEERSGMFIAMARVTRVAVSASPGRTALAAGTRSTSSKVRASRISIGTSVGGSGRLAASPFTRTKAWQGPTRDCKPRACVMNCAPQAPGRRIMRVAVIENMGVTHHGQVGVALHEAGALVDVFRPFADQRLPDFAAYAAVVVFGGEQAAVDDVAHPYLPRLGAAMRAAAEGGQPVLGLCLGAQVLARGLGARNRIGKAREFGWTRIALTEEGAGDPVLSAAGETFMSFEWHSDGFDMPAGAVALATSANVAEQAFRVGRAGYGVQFHFEANRAVVADWVRRFPAAVDAMDPRFRERMERRARTEGAAADRAGLRLARAFVALAGR